MFTRKSEARHVSLWLCPHNSPWRLKEIQLKAFLWHSPLPVNEDVLTSLLGFLHAATQLALHISSPNSLQYIYVYKKLTNMWRPFLHVSENPQLFLIENLHPPEHPLMFRDVVKGTLRILTTLCVLTTLCIWKTFCILTTLCISTTLFILTTLCVVTTFSILTTLCIYRRSLFERRCVFQRRSEF